ncbi:MAG: ribosomal RNA small subunit methyltransferase A, partial [Phycisphaerae bacterium]
LVGKVRKVIAVEIDRCLVAILTERFASIGNISIVAGDILAHKHALRREVVEAFSGIDAAAGGGVKLVANLPYQVATPLVMNLLTDHPNVRRLCFTVQAEVADRITACENSKAFGPLSILTQTMCDVIPIVRLPPTAFWPRPAVNSVMLRLDVRTRLPFDRAEVEPFVRFVRGVFGHRRKTLRAALACFVDHAAQERVCRCFDPLRRPETFSVGEWLEVFRVFRTGYGAGG